MPVERPDWEPTEAPEPLPQRPQSISRPDWIDGVEVSAPPVRQQGIERPDWQIEEEEGAELEPEPVVTTPDPRQEALQASVAVAMDSIPAEYVEDFEAGFDELPDGVQTAIADALGEVSSTATDAEGLGRFAEMDEGRELLDEWGEEASNRVGLIQDRVARIESTASLSDVEAMWDWYDNLSPGQAMAVLKALAE